MDKIFRYFESLIQPFTKAPVTTPPTTLRSFYWFYIKQAKPLLLTLLGLGFFKTLLEIYLFEFIGRIVDLLDTASSPATLFKDNSWTFFWIIFVIVVARPIIGFLHNLILNQSLKSNFTSLIRWQQHRHLLQQSLNFFHSNFSGSIANRVLSTGMSMRHSVLLSIDSLWQVVIYAVTTLVLFMQLSPWLALPVVCWIALYVLMLRYYIPLSRKRSHEAAKARSALMGHVVDSYTNISTLKLFSHTEREEKQAEDIMRYQTEKAQQSMRVMTSLNTSLLLLNSFLIISVLGVALMLWQQSVISTGAIAFALSLIIRINGMSSWIMHVVSGIFEDIGSVQDGVPIMTARPDITDHADATALQLSAGEIRFNAVDFAYHEHKPLFKQFNLHIQPGEKVAVVGPSGAGKSTLTSLLLRLYEAQSGSITIDQQAIKTVQQDSLRGQIGVVTQDTVLLHRSVRDNLLYGKPDATEDELWQVLKYTKSDAFVAALTDQYGNHGLDALVGENGIKLSGGQRQRITIARVLLKNAPILVLDEATSALDSESEAVIQEHLDRLMQGKTVIAIAHRLSTIAKMDRIVVLDEGQIIESGSHDALIEQNGLYASLWHRQMLKR